MPDTMPCHHAQNAIKLPTPPCHIANTATPQPPLLFHVMRFHLDQLPPNLRSQAERQLGIGRTAAQLADWSSVSPKKTPPTPPPPPQPTSPANAIPHSTTPSIPETNPSARPTTRTASRKTAQKRPSDASKPPRAQPTAKIAPMPHTPEFARPVQLAKLATTPYQPKSSSKPPMINLRSDKMSRTEVRYLRDVLHGNALFEPITLKSASGNRYTPDFLTLDDGVPTLHEVKGAYRLGSEGRAHTAFFEAAAQFSSIFRFVWATLEKGGRWSVKTVINRSAISSDEDFIPDVSVHDSDHDANSANPENGEKNGTIANSDQLTFFT